MLNIFKKSIKENNNINDNKLTKTILQDTSIPRINRKLAIKLIHDELKQYKTLKKIYRLEKEGDTEKAERLEQIYKDKQNEIDGIRNKYNYHYIGIDNLL